jgi:hypothetical protein
MKTPLLFAAALVGVSLFFSGCETRSISNSEYNSGWRYNSSNYRGELTEFEVLGVDTGTSVTDSDIASELQNSRGAKLRRNSKILLIQSGAEFPDAPMMDVLGQHFTVMAFSGKPDNDRTPHPAWRRDAQPEPTVITQKLSYSKALRLAAARGGYDKIVCYWGVLESARVNKATKFVSWVPIVGYALPDERENMRIRLKAVILDVASGRWTFVTPNPIESSGLSSIYSREDKDQSLVNALKDTAYRNLSKTLAESYED